MNNLTRCFFIACLAFSSSSWGEIRPLVKRSADECNPAYLDAIKPTPDEVAQLFALAIKSVLYSAYDMEVREDVIKTSTLKYQQHIVSRTDHEETLKNSHEYMTKAMIRRDQCWKFADDIKPSSLSLNLTLLDTAWRGKGLGMTPALVNKLLAKGASIDATLPKLTKTSFSIFYSGDNGEVPPTGGLFPLMIRGAMQKSPSLFTDEMIVRDLQRRFDFIRFIIANIKDPSTINARAIDPRTGPTALEYAVSAGDDRLINLLLDSGADPKIPQLDGRGVMTKAMIDIYSGKDINVIKRLSGVAIRFNRPEVGTPHDWDVTKGTVPTEASSESLAGSTIPPAANNSVPPTLVASYVGVVKSSLQRDQPIAAKGQINDHGQFEYIGDNGVVMRGAIDATGSAILGTGVTRLPSGPNGQAFTYPNGAVEAEIVMKAQFDGQILSGEYSSKYEKGTFVLCTPAARENPACTVTPNPIGNLLKGLGSLLGSAVR